MSMPIAIDNNWKERLERNPSEFLQQIEDIGGDKPLPSAHLMRRAWEDFGLDGIFYTNQTPYIYFKEVSLIDPEEIRRLHLQLWNQGVAPLLAVISPKEIHIYSGLASPTQNAEEINQGDRLVDILERTADGLELRNFIRSVELGELFREKAKSFNPNLRVDRDLLRNLEATRNFLLEHTSNSLQDIKTVNAFLWRVIFTCYLIDREVIDSSYFSQFGADNIYRLIDLFLERDFEEVKEYLYKLFSKLQQDFNGDLFDGDLQIEKQQIQPSQIKILKRFLQGDDIKTGQYSLGLGFWAYDFKVIPIETISGIYERFIELEDSTTDSEETKRKTGTYYTPRFLAEVTLDVALEGWNSLLDKKFLDPACGSGIFLVALFNRLAEEWRWKNGLVIVNNEERASALINILQNNIVGIDVSQTACRIAAFSLYLAFLDQLEPRDIQKLQAEGNVLPMLVGHTLFAKNFFEKDLFLSEENFDLIVGNPPWAKISGKPKNIMELWCEDANYTIPQRQLACGFVVKAPTHLKNDGRVCFLLPAGILFNHQEKALQFQHQWFSRYTIEQVINLADLRFYLFDNADHATLIVRYNPKIPNSHTGYINYVSPKTQPETLMARILTIAPEDQLKIRLKEVLYDLEKSEASLIWKQSFWGTARDRKFLDRLNTWPLLSELVDSLANLKFSKNQEKRWIIGQGFQPQGISDDKKKKKVYVSPWPSETLFLEGNQKIDLILLPSDCEPIQNRFPRLRRLPNPIKIFSAPHVIISKSLKVAFADFDLLFRHAFQGIHGSQEDRDKLIFLSAILNSKLAKYFLFHTSSTQGIERGDVRISEMLRLPFFLPESAFCPSDSNALIQEIVEIIEGTKKEIQNQLLDRDKIVFQTKQRLADLVYQYYDVDDLEKILIEDTVNVWIPSITPNQDGTRSIPALETSTLNQRRQYVTTLCNLLNNWAKGGYYQIIAKIIVSKKIGAGIVILERVTMGEQVLKFPEEDSSEALNKVMKRIISLLPNQQGNISFLRNLKIFDENLLYIFKPLSYRFWTKTYALNDADEIASAILNPY